MRSSKHLLVTDSKRHSFASFNQTFQDDFFHRFAAKSDLHHTLFSYSTTIMNYSNITIIISLSDQAQNLGRFEAHNDLLKEARAAIEKSTVSLAEQRCVFKTYYQTFG